MPWAEDENAVLSLVGVVFFDGPKTVVGRLVEGKQRDMETEEGRERERRTFSDGPVRREPRRAVRVEAAHAVAHQVGPGAVKDEVGGEQVDVGGAFREESSVYCPGCRVNRNERVGEKGL